MDTVLKTNILVLPASDINNDLLIDFYKAMYPERKNLLPRVWKWLNRFSSPEGKGPLVVLYNNRVVAHAAMIPFTVTVKGVQYTASWFVDFVVLPQFQKKGIGTLLARQFMEFFDLCVEIGHNEKSGSVFKRLGWIKSANTYLHLYLLLPFNHPKFRNKLPLSVCKILDVLPRVIFQHFYHTYLSSFDVPYFNKLDADSLIQFVYYGEAKEKNVIPSRTLDYLSWRLLESPDKDEYSVFTIATANDAAMIIKRYEKQRYIDILLLSPRMEYSVIRCMISALAVWGMAAGYSHIRFYTSDEELSYYLTASLHPVLRYPGFTFYAKDDILKNILTQCSWHWELIDNDFEELSRCIR